MSMGSRRTIPTNPRLSLGTSPIDVPLWQNAHYVTTSIPVGEVLSIFCPHLMCPCALQVVTNHDGIAGESVSLQKLDHTHYYVRMAKLSDRKGNAHLPIESLKSLVLCRQISTAPNNREEIRTRHQLRWNSNLTHLSTWKTRSELKSNAPIAIEFESNASFHLENAFRIRI